VPLGDKGRPECLASFDRTEVPQIGWKAGG
jgi:hypothetical protein